MSESKIDLIAKLLAKAEQTTPEEAEALTAAAEKLMVKYAIDQAVIDDRRAREGKASEKIIETPIIFQGVYARALLDLGTSVVFALGTMRPLASSRGSRQVLYIVGFESDVNQAEILVRSLHLQGIVAMKQWWGENRDRYSWGSDADKRRGRTEFIRGFGNGASARIRENRQQTIDEASNGTELVLVSRKGKVDEFVDGMNLRKAKAHSRRGDSFANLHGNRAGREAHTGEKGLTHGRVLEAGR